MSLAAATPVLLLAGGPDREAAVSRRSAATLATLLRCRGHRVTEREVDPAAMDAVADWVATHPGGVVFPALHGPWGEGGGVQRELERRGLPFVGCGSAAAATAMDKAATKAAVAAAGVAVAEAQLLHAGGPGPTLPAPVVLKPNADGSSFDVVVCHDDRARDQAWVRLAGRNPQLLCERLLVGEEVSVGWALTPGAAGGQVLPPVCIRPAGGIYDHAAKYERDDTTYHFDSVGLAAVVERLQMLTRTVVEVLGARHITRVDFIVTPETGPVFLEANTLPGFTDHSLVPMALAQAGLDAASVVSHWVLDAAPG